MYVRKPFIYHFLVSSLLSELGVGGFLHEIEIGKLIHWSVLYQQVRINQIDCVVQFRVKLARPPSANVGKN